MHTGIVTVPRKIRQLKTDLRRAGFTFRTGKGDHTFWTHPEAPTVAVSLDGKDGQDARQYQEREVRDALRALEATRAAREQKG
jgi:predicted RNA binding protein YcfA (HicA-like mRNA interferase family)